MALHLLRPLLNKLANLMMEQELPGPAWSCPPLRLDRHLVASCAAPPGQLGHKGRVPGAPRLYFSALPTLHHLHSGVARPSAVVRRVSEGGSKPGEPQRLSASVCDSGEWSALPELLVLRFCFKTCWSCRSAQQDRLADAATEDFVGAMEEYAGSVGSREA